LVPFVIAATAVRKRIALGPETLPEMSTKITSPPSAVGSTYISVCVSLKATTMCTSPCGAVGAATALGTPRGDADFFFGAFGGTGWVGCGGVDGAGVVMVCGVDMVWCVCVCVPGVFLVCSWCVLF